MPRKPQYNLHKAPKMREAWLISVRVIRARWKEDPEWDPNIGFFAHSLMGIGDLAWTTASQLAGWAWDEGLLNMTDGGWFIGGEDPLTEKGRVLYEELDQIQKAEPSDEDEDEADGGDEG